jgi:hypothetical protein
MKTTNNEWAAWARCEKKLREMANTRPYLNPNGPTPLIPANKRLTAVNDGKLVTVISRPPIDPDYM